MEEVRADCKASKVVVKGKGLDPKKVCQRIEKKSGRKVEIISPLPTNDQDDKQQQVAQENKDPQPKQENKQEVYITTLLQTNYMYTLHVYVFGLNLISCSRHKKHSSKVVRSTAKKCI